MVYNIDYNDAKLIRETMYLGVMGDESTSEENDTAIVRKRWI